MNKLEFLTKLEQLLQDIPEDEKQEALNFYENYFEDAGPENEQSIIRELESPEKVAQSIRSGCTEDEEITDGNMPIRTDSYEKQNYTEHTDEGGSGEAKEHKIGKSYFQEHKTASIIMIVIALLLFSSIFTHSFGILGFLVGILGALIGIAVGTAGGAIGFLIGGVALFVVGIGLLLVSVPLGLVMMGAGLILVVLGLLCLILCVLFCGKFLPWLWKNLKKLWNHIFSNNKEVAA